MLRKFLGLPTNFLIYWQCCRWVIFSPGHRNAVPLDLLQILQAPNSEWF